MQNGVTSGHLFAKSYGAQKIYCIIQVLDTNLASTESKSDTEKVARELESLASTINSESESLDNLRKRISLQQQSRANADKESQLVEKLRVMHKQISLMESNYAEQGPFADVGDELRATFDRISQELTRRKRIANELLGFLSETSETSRRDLIEELGLESVPSTLHTPHSTLSPSRGC